MNLPDSQNSSGCGEYLTALRTFLDSCLVQRDVEKVLALVTDDISGFGIGVQEVAHNRTEFRSLLCTKLAQSAFPSHYVLDQLCEKQTSPDTALCMAVLTVMAQPEEGRSTSCAVRLTAGFRRESGIPLVCYLHVSEVSASQQGCDFFPMHDKAFSPCGNDSDRELSQLELMKKMLPGGAMGGYAEPNFPLYFINDELLNWLGYTYETFLAENGNHMANDMHPDDVARVERVISDAFQGGSEYTAEYRLRKSNGTYIWVRDVGRGTVGADGRTAMVSIVTDITGEKQRLQSFEHTIESLKKERRVMDRLTGLLNRDPAESLIEQHLCRKKAGAFFLMDIDNFKLVNDAKGHPAGDSVLHAFAQHLKEAFPSTGVLSRMGGDEFVVFLPEYETLNQLQGYAESILERSTHLTEDPLLSGRLGVSIGIALAPQDGETLADLYVNADKSQYFTKQNGKSGYSFYRQQPSGFRDVGHTRLSIQTLHRMVRNVRMDKGAFFVEYEAFRKVYQFMERNAARMQRDTQLMLFSLQLPPSAVLDGSKNLHENREALERAIRYGLRTGDLMLNFSPSQVVVLLVNCDAENAALVARRILNAYTHAKDETKPAVTYEFFSISEDTE